MRGSEIWMLNGKQVIENIKFYVQELVISLMGNGWPPKDIYQERNMVRMKS